MTNLLIFAGILTLILYVWNLYRYYTELQDGFEIFNPNFKEMMSHLSLNPYVYTLLFLPVFYSYLVSKIAQFSMLVYMWILRKTVRG